MKDTWFFFSHADISKQIEGKVKSSRRNVLAVAGWEVDLAWVKWKKMCWWIHSGVCLFYRPMHAYQWAEIAAEMWPLDVNEEDISGWFPDHNLRNAQTRLHLSASCLRPFGLYSRFSIWTPNLVFQLKLCLVDMVAAEKRGPKVLIMMMKRGLPLSWIYLMILRSSYMRCLCLPHLCSLQGWKHDCVDIHFPQKFKGSPSMVQSM